MDKLSAVRSIVANVWIGDGVDADSYWVEGEPVEVQVERTDTDEIRVGVHLNGQTQEAVGLYVKRSEAIRLMLAIAQAVGDR